MIYSSDRISISHLHPDDALHLNKLLVSNTERFIRFLPKTLADNRTLDSTHFYITKKMMSAEKNAEFVLVLKDKYAFKIIGLVIIKNIDYKILQCEFAYCIGEHSKGKGLMTEAIKAVSHYVQNDLGLKTIQIIAHKTNLNSIKVALNSGFQWKKTLVNEYTPLNEAPLDMELYELN